MTSVVELDILAYTASSCNRKQATKLKVFMPKAQDPMTLIHELVKALSLYANTGVNQQSHVSRNFNFKSASKKVQMQKS